MRFYGENMVNLTTRMVRLYGDCMETEWKVILSWRFYDKICLEIVLGFHGRNMVNQITRSILL